MKKVVWKAFWDHEKEEDWLNAKSAEGMGMTGYKAYRYTFEDCDPGEYTYRIDLLKQSASDPESVRYIGFLAGSGAEHIATYRSWIYLRKKAADGEFELYHDLDSRISHYSRIANLWRLVAICEFCVLFTQINGLISTLEERTESALWVLYVLTTVLVLAVGTLFLRLWLHYGKKVKQLRREREIRE